MSAAGSLAKIAKRRALTPGEQNRLMAALQQARMACNAAALVDKETQGSPKLEELVTLLDELCLQGGHKAVVFSQWALMTELVEQQLRRIGASTVVSENIEASLELARAAIKSIDYDRQRGDAILSNFRRTYHNLIENAGETTKRDRK